jgi:hypothetical protein
MAKITELDKQWHELMFLCERESTFRQQGSHPKLLTLVVADIEALSRRMGFSSRQIDTREFRAVRDGGHIVRIIDER